MNMHSGNLQADPAVVRAFLEIISAQAARALNGAHEPGLLQLVCIPAAGGTAVTSRFPIGAVDRMVEAALGDAASGHNVYVQARTVAKRTKKRGKIEDTRAVIAFAIDTDADKGKGGKVEIDASLTVETSPGNCHRWLFLDKALTVEEAKPIGIAIRAAAGADSDTGVLTQPYRVAGTPNFPNQGKIARGRVCTPTRILEQAGTLWTPAALLAAFPPKPRPDGAGRTAGPGKAGPFARARIEAFVSEHGGDRSSRFFSAVRSAVEVGMTLDELEEVMRRHPEGCAAKYLENVDRLREELERAWPKAEERMAEKAAAAGDETVEAALEIDPVLSHDSVARAFALRHAGKLRFDHDAGRWHEWDGVHWRQDRRDRAFQHVRAIGREMGQGSKDATRREVGKVQFAAGVERLARGDAVFAVTTEDWDRDAYLLGTPGGTVDLRTGEMRPADPAEGITKLTAVAPAEAADCPRFLQFLDETFKGDVSLIALMQRWLGYSATGDTREHAMVFGEGPGGNGKGVLINTVAGVLGDYATTASMEVFTASDWDRHPTELARLRGARFVTASEIEEGRQWAEARIKALTGVDMIAARFMRRDFFEFRPAFKLFIIGNHRPSLRNVDEAMRRRLNVVAFDNKPAVPDRHLEEKLRGEWPGILRWMLDGCLAWKANGLQPPEAVRDTTRDYFDAQDSFGAWLDEACIVKPENDHLRATTKELFASWATYAKAAGEPAGTETSFAGRLTGRGLRKCKAVTTVTGPRGRGFFGIQLRLNSANQREAA